MVSLYILLHHVRLVAGAMFVAFTRILVKCATHCLGCHLKFNLLESSETSNFKMGGLEPGIHHSLQSSSFSTSLAEKYNLEYKDIAIAEEKTLIGLRMVASKN
jgi:hypothetical protein